MIEETKVLEPPIDLAYWRRRWPAVVVPSDAEVRAAVLVNKSVRRRSTRFPHVRKWLAEHEPELSVFLEDIDDRGDWIALKTLRKTQQPHLPPLLGFARLLPRLRALGSLIIEEREAAEHAPAPSADASGEGSGGRKGKPRAVTEARDDDEPTNPEAVYLPLNEVEFKVPTPF